MRNILAVILLVASAVPAGAEDNWKLVWSDEFDYTGLPDPNKWDYEEGFLRNQEAQYYMRARKQNSWVENGTLVMRAVKEQIKNPRFREGADHQEWAAHREVANYTSASLTTCGKASWQHARVEVRAKLPAGRGMWPAIWMLGDTIKEVGWPACGEIDIMEFVGHVPNTIHANIHTAKYNHVRGNGKGAQQTVADPHSVFHVYAVEWDEKRMDFFIDDEKYFTYRNEGTGTEAWPYESRFYLILNIAVGGSWGGREGIDDAIFPQSMIVDYVRVYQKGNTEQASPATTR